MTGQGFSRSERLLRKAEFRRVFDHGRSRADDLLIVYARPRDEEGPARLGLVVGRKFGPAVRRNAFKRRVRESFRLEKERLPEGHDLVVLPILPDRRSATAAIRESLVRVARRAAASYAERGPRRGGRAR